MKCAEEVFTETGENSKTDSVLAGGHSGLSITRNNRPLLCQSFSLGFFAELPLAGCARQPIRTTSGNVQLLSKNDSVGAYRRK